MFVAGCATHSDTAVLPQIDVPTAWREPAVVDRDAPPPSTRWWTLLASPQLDRLLDAAVRSAPDLRTAQSRLLEARARRALAGAGTAPRIDASASAGRSRTSPATTSVALTRNLFDAGFDASWEIDLFGRLRAGVDAADADLGAARASLRDTLVSLRAEVARNYLELRGLQQRLAIARDNLAIQSETLNIASWRVQAGLAGELDSEQALTNREQTRAQVFVLQSGVEQSRQRLELLLGLAPGALVAELALPGRPTLPDLPVLPALSIPADVLRQRADLRAAGLQWLAESARTAQARASLYPRLTLSGSIGLQALTLGTLKDGTAASLLAGLTAPVFDAGRLRAQLAAQTAVQQRLAVGYEQAVLTALHDVETSLVALAGSRLQAAALAIAANAARRAARLARTNYEGGQIDFRSVLDAERSLLVVEDSLATALTDALRAWASLYKALGGGAPLDAADVDALAGDAGDAGATGTTGTTGGASR